MRASTSMGVILTGLISAGCTNTHDYVGVWCGAVEWSWSYTYFDTVYEEPNFRIEDTCWAISRTYHSLTAVESLQVSNGETSDGWCRFHAPESDRELSMDSDCGFVMQAQDQNGNVFALEQSWRLDSGQMSLVDPNLSISADFTTATYFDGNEIWGEASLFYEGSEIPDVDPVLGGGLYDERNSCEMNGCWMGAFEGNVVTGPASCSEVISNYSFDGKRIEISENGRGLVVAGEHIPTFPYMQSCEVVGRLESAGETWTYRFNEAQVGSMQIEIGVTVPAGPGLDDCEFFWQASAGICPTN